MTGSVAMLRINMWSSPRNISTALMYAFAQRSDTTVVDEPLYAHYLATTGRVHPGNAEVLAAQNNDGAAVVGDVILGSYDTPVVFFKQMAKHLVELDRSFMTAGRNVLLTRDPHDMLTSLQLQLQLPDATLADTGLTELVEILDELVVGGETPIVIDSKSLLSDPPRVLDELCARLGLAFDDAMLAWPPGPKPEDGVWARHWYSAVHQSTGFEPWRPKHEPLAPNLERVLDEAYPLHARLQAWAIT